MGRLLQCHPGAPGIFSRTGVIVPTLHPRMRSSAHTHLVCFAVPQESGPFHCRTKGRHDLRVIHVGMGKDNAKQAFEKALATGGFARVITAGFAGGLNPDLVCGDVVIDADAAFLPLPEMKGVRVTSGSFHCAEGVATTPQEKAELRDSTEADAVEMESGVIREICAERGIPSATVRVISDAANESLPLDFNSLMKADMSMDYLKLAGALIRSPGKIPELMRFQGRLKNAAQNLSQVLVRLIEADR